MPARSKPFAKNSAAAPACEDYGRPGIEAGLGNKSAGSLRAVQHADLCADCLLSNGSESFNQCGGCRARRASGKPKARPLSLPRKRDIHQATTEADLMENALHDRAFTQHQAIPQFLSEAKNSMTAFRGQICGRAHKFSLN